MTTAFRWGTTMTLVPNRTFVCRAPMYANTVIASSELR